MPVSDDKTAWLKRLGVTALPTGVAAAGPAKGGDDVGSSGSVGDGGDSVADAADGRAPTIAVTSNGDGTFTITGKDFLANSGVLISAADRAADRAYGTAQADGGGAFSFTTVNICPSPPPITFMATSGIDSKTDRTDWVWSNLVQTECPAAGGSGGDGDGDGDGDGNGGSGAAGGSGGDGDGSGAPGGSDGDGDGDGSGSGGSETSDGSDDVGSSGSASADDGGGADGGDGGGGGSDGGADGGDGGGGGGSDGGADGGDGGGGGGGSDGGADGGDGGTDGGGGGGSDGGADGGADGGDPAPRKLETLDRDGDGDSTPSTKAPDPNLLGSPEPAVGGAFAFEAKIETPPAKMKYAEATGALKYTLKVEPVETAEAPGKVTLKNGEPEYKVELEKHLREHVKIVGDGKVSGKKGEIAIWAEFEGTKYSSTSIGFEVMEVDAQKGKITWAALVWKSEFTIPGREVELLGVKFKYSGKITPEIKLEPEYVQIAKDMGLDKLIEALSFDAVVGGALAAVAIGTVLGVASMFVNKVAKDKILGACADAIIDLNKGVRAGLAGEAKGGSEMFQAGWDIGDRARQTAVAKLNAELAKPGAEVLLPDEFAERLRVAADKAVRSWPAQRQLDGQIRDLFWHRWADENHGIGTTLGDAKVIVSNIYRTDEDEKGPHMIYWSKQSFFNGKLWHV
jgi:hypothetical protein